MKAAFVVDSTSGLNDELANRPDVYVFNLTVAFDNGDVHKDTTNPELAERFYDQLEKAKTIPKTAQAAPADYVEIFDDIVKKGYDTVFIITLASKLSGTFETVNIVAQNYSDQLDIHGIDSKGTSYIIEGLLEQGLDLVETEKTADEVQEDLEWLVENSKIYFMVVSLQNLAKGGRIGSASALIGGVLSIRPILEFNPDGTIGVYQKVRTTKNVFKSWSKIIDQVVADYPEGVKIYLAHGHAEKTMKKAEKIISADHSELTFRTGFLTPILGTHGGKGSLGMGYMPSIRNKKS